MRIKSTGFLKFFLTLVGLAITVCFAVLFVGWPAKTKNVEYGVTMSWPYAQELGLDHEKVLTSALDDVGLRRFRLSAYWKLMEPEKGKWDFSILDKQVEEIGKRNGKVILAIGEKLPRWPECWAPDWWKVMSREPQRELTLRYLETVVTRYRDNPTIAAWQVENEPHFIYGDCPPPDYLFIERETAFVRGLDPMRPIYTTDSGELSSWLTLGVFADKLGVSVYRVVRNPLLGDWNFHYFFLPPYFYARKAWLTKLFGVKGIYVSEFQMEPWSNKKITETPIKDQLSNMDLKQMIANFSFAERMGLPAVDFWGIEWWYWMKDKGHPEFMDQAIKFFTEHQK